MTQIPRRAAMIGALAALTMTTACGNGVGSSGASVIDSRVDAVLLAVEQEIPSTRDLREKSVGMLVMPLITEAGFGFGASYGKGALRINGATVDYYSAAEGSFGFQIGAQQYSHILYFMTDDALAQFRASPGWAAGGDIEYVVSNKGDNISTDTTSLLSPVIGVVFGQAGLLAGATVQGTKYTRIIP